MTDREYHDLITHYEDAGRIMRTRLEILNQKLNRGPKEEQASCGPVHNIQWRIKAKESVEEKLKRMGLLDTSINAKDYLQDICGIRVICYFVKDIYDMADSLKRQADLVVMKEKDYIASPKPNGYRSYHIVVGVPIYCLDSMEYFPVETQFRTISMDFWASMEHRICYKKNITHKEEVREELLGYAETLKKIEERFETYNELHIEKAGS
ncbi:GTP pyrophosphokinase [Lacrimispora sp. 210928-DFI.3.58]|uniref:GTP pyrophosphokinase n=1 Tax=Lacrimispora sp. 210928-DFI.3.58 TaxID=2883214 RepID=UPI0015B3E73A|nr:(p)ppGpp synthetase [Lacrimispora sp. 210928-DFI.3.58]MCB7317994.1 (p)ppGpp synthetase [Lacrimispora sp. 210928-DFI.3.58]